MDWGWGIAVDTNSNVVSAGFTANLYPGGGWLANGFEVHKYSPTGAAMWSDRINDVGGTAQSVGTDAAGNIYLGGSFAGTVDFNPNASKKNSINGSTLNGVGVAASYGINAFVLKLTPTGTFGWVDGFIPQTKKSPNARAFIQDLAVDPAGNVFAGGEYDGQVNFISNSSGTYSLPNVSSSDEAFVAKIAPAGALAWVNPLGAGLVKSVAIDSSDSVYAIGWYTTDSGSSGAFVTKLTSSGVLSWTVTMSGPGSASGLGIGVDGSGNLHLCGDFSGSVDFDSDVLNNDSGYSDMFLLILNQH